MPATSHRALPLRSGLFKVASKAPRSAPVSAIAPWANHQAMAISNRANAIGGEFALSTSPCRRASSPSLESNSFQIHLGMHPALRHRPVHFRPAQSPAQPTTRTR